MSKLFILLLISVFALMISLSSSAAKDEENYLKIKDLRLLIVVYRGALDAQPDQRIDDAKLELIKNAIECGRLFYFRNSFGRLNLTLSYALIDTIDPDNSGPTYDNIVKDLRSRGYVDNQFDGLYTTGVGMAGNWGGFSVFDKTGAAFSGGGGGGQLTWFPSSDKSIGFDWTWGFVHEFQHALDLTIAGGFGFQDFLHGHPYADTYEMTEPLNIENPGAQHFDWEACTLRNFKHYIQIPGATGSYIYALDSDGDGLADYHPSLPMDEKRFGTNPFKKDTDGDGLDDLQEFTADIYFGSNPLDMDTDGDGIPDGADLFPTVAINPSIGYAYPMPANDGKIEKVFSPLITKWYATDWENLPKDAVQTFACWDEENLYLAVRAPDRFNMDVQLDTSAHNGFWEGGDTYIWNIKADGKPSLGIPNIPEWPGSNAVWTKDDGGNVILKMTLPVMVGQGWSREANFGGPRLPEDVADGLVLLDGRAISFNISLHFPEKNKRVLLTPTWSMIATKLQKDSRDPDLPILRFSESMQNTETPIVRVDGIASTTLVTIVDDKGKVLGEGKGTGAIELKGVKVGSDPESGKNIIIAKTSTGKQSKPFTLIIDNLAKPPVLKKSSIEGNIAKVAITGEPNAKVIIRAVSGDGDANLPISTIKLDDKGNGTVDINTGFEGFLGEYFNDVNWEKSVWWRIDPQIKFDYDGGEAIKNITSPENFSIRWTGFIEVKNDTKATFFLSTDDGSRLYIGDKVVVDHWGHHGKSEKAGETTLKAGIHPIRIDYYEEFGWAAAHIEWQPEGGERTYILPVRIFEKMPAKKLISAIQIDKLGNVSEPSLHLELK